MRIAYFSRVDQMCVSYGSGSMYHILRLSSRQPTARHSSEADMVTMVSGSWIV